MVCLSYKYYRVYFIDIFLFFTFIEFKLKANLDGFFLIKFLELELAFKLITKIKNI